ncbi:MULTISPECIES: methylthioribose kinase [Sporosarcina]|uniref:Methylthioribose kinase n=1 Tax=Sporosarcina contaminans TaxID=633403 RepID=A0ABW3TUJ4_9BACL
MLQQTFIELGGGYGDVYELIELITTNQPRLHRTFIFTHENESGQFLSLAAAFRPAGESKFMPIYICREGIQQKGDAVPARRRLFEEAALHCGSNPVIIPLKHSTEFADVKLFYQYIIGILRLNHLLPPLQ